MVYKIESDISTPSGGDVFLQKSMPCATPLFGVLLSCSKSATGLSKGGESSNVIPAKKTNQRLNGVELVPDTRKSYGKWYALKGKGCKADFEGQI